MALSLSNFLYRLGWLCSFISAAAAATVTYDFNITWVLTNPDGLHERPTIGINGAWPLPIIRVTKGDRLIVNVDNQLGNQTTSLHFHGIFQNGTNEMDGPRGVTQCEIPNGSKFTYEFQIEQPGTYWYHSHDRHYPDGIRAPLIIEDPDFPYADDVDETIIMSVSDWYHDHMTDLIRSFSSKTNPTGAEPVPQSALLNDTQNLTINVDPGKTYMFRMVNIGAFAGQYIWFEGHNMTIVEVDGVYTEQAEAEMIYLSAAQRCSFLLTTKNDTSTNYAFRAMMDTDLFDVLPADLNYNSTGWLVYNESQPKPEPAAIDATNEFDDLDLVPHDKMALLPEPDREIVMDVIMDNLGDGKPYAFFNNITYTAPKVPTLYTVLSTGEDASNPLVYGEYTSPFVLQRNEVVQIVLNNLDSGKHPFHLHGHNFQIISRSWEEAGAFNSSNTTQTTYSSTPIRRDTIVLRPAGNVVLRYRADNPGVWLFHCHIEWHMDQGLIATMIEAPLDLQKSITVPQDHYDACNIMGIATKGNAAGNTKNYLDLAGELKAPKPLPAGFTARGVVALVFSVIAAVVGMAVISWYGLADMGEASRRAEEQRVTAAGRSQ